MTDGFVKSWMSHKENLLDPGSFPRNNISYTNHLIYYGGNIMNAKSLVKVKYAEGVIEYNTTFARMMENPLSDEYALLQKLKMENPTFLVRHRRIKTNPKKDTYKGLTYSYMRSYISTHEPKETLEAVLHEFDEMILISQCHGRQLRYPTIKKWFLAKYPEVAQFGVEPEAVEDAAETQEQNVIPYNAEGNGSQAEANELKEGA